MVLGHNWLSAFCSILECYRAIVGHMEFTDSRVIDAVSAAFSHLPNLANFRATIYCLELMSACAKRFHFNFLEGLGDFSSLLSFRNKTFAVETALIAFISLSLEHASLDFHKIDVSLLQIASIVVREGSFEQRIIAGEFWSNCIASHFEPMKEHMVRLNVIQGLIELFPVLNSDAERRALLTQLHRIGFIAESTNDQVLREHLHSLDFSPIFEEEFTKDDSIALELQRLVT
jgi:hypothetical protein